MPLAKDIAIELRKMADALDKEPETEVQQCWISYVCSDRQIFLNTARLMPRPFTKKYYDEGDKYPKIKIGSKDFSGPIHWNVSAPRDVACRVIEPAKPAVYDCTPLLSEEEDAALSAEGGQ